MRRVSIKPRADWRPGLRKYPYGVRAMSAGALWREDACYEFTASQIDLIESVADELHIMAREAVRLVVERKLFRTLGLPGDLIRHIEASWTDYWSGGRMNEREGGLIGRLTLAYDGRDQIKLLGLNYEIPDGLFASSLIQRNWRDAQSLEADQFNGLHEALVERWEELATCFPTRNHVHLTCATPDPLREGELVYLSGTASEAGVSSRLVPLQQIGWDGSRFVDDEGSSIGWMGKLYPWENLYDDAFQQRLRSGGVNVVAPLWSSLMSNHGLLAVLWDLYPRHANLCPASFDPAELGGADLLTGRDLFGLDAAPQRIIDRDRNIVVDGGLADDRPAVWFETPQGFEQDGAHAVLHAWVIADKCLGMSVREGDSPLIGPSASVVPHVFRG